MADGEAPKLTARVLGAIAEIDAEAWDRLAEAAPAGRSANPFLAHRFLAALEASGSVGPRAGWTPAHLVLEDATGRAVAAAPLYAKTHSQGEYVFDHGWADAYQRAGGRYYPKLQASVPFTPVPGRRLLVAPDAPGWPPEALERALVDTACGLAEANGWSSLHLTFCTEGEWSRLGAVGLLQRQDQQFHWSNRGYATYDDFLATLASRKRKALRKERAAPLEAGVTLERLTGAAIEPAHWDAFWAFYQDTGARKWGRPYLTRAFFDLVQRDMRDDVVLVMARRAGRYIAGALNFLGRDALYGRYWGCVEEAPSLHFEACYHQAIDEAIARGLARVEAGAQGAHKLARGYLPTPTYSAHWIAHDGLRAAVARYLRAERAAVAEEMAALAEHAPYRRDQAGRAAADCEGD